MSNISSIKPIRKISLARIHLDIPKTAKLVLLVIATHLGKNQFAFVSTRTLLKECEMRSKNQLDKIINLLVAYGLLVKLPPIKGYKSNRYSINFDLIEKIKTMTAPLRGGSEAKNDCPLLKGTRLPPFWLKTLITAPSRVGHKEKALKDVLKENPFNSENQTALETKAKAEEAREAIRNLCRKIPH